MVLEKEVRHWWVLVDRRRPHLDHEGRCGVGGGPWHRERPVLGASGRWQDWGWYYCSCALGGGELVAVRLGMFGGGVVFL